MGSKMTIPVLPFADCVCKKMRNTHSLCGAELTFAEQGKKIRLSTRRDEEAVALVLDGCVFTDKDPKCDGLFLWKGNTKKCALLVELKGAHTIRRAFEQIDFVRRHREEYRTLVENFRSCEGPGMVIEKAVIVSNGMKNTIAWEKLENEYGFRASAVLQCEATSTISDVREFCR